MQSGAKDFRLPKRFFNDTPVPDTLKALWSWIKSIRKAEDCIVVFDGRFTKVRRYFDNELAGLGETFDLWLIYKTPADDARYPKNKMAFCNNNRETILVYRPTQNKKDSCTARDDGFNACGEESTHDLTYSGYDMRTLGELPKLTVDDKQKLMGTDLNIPLSYDEKDMSVADGVPFAWQETKPVYWWSAFFKDMNFDHVFDTTTGSIAAAIGANYANIQYDGMCLNTLHKAWCEKLMNQATFAVVSEEGAGATKEHAAKVRELFGPVVDDGMRMIKVDEEEEEKPDPEPKSKNLPEDPPAPEPEPSDTESDN